MMRPRGIPSAPDSPSVLRLKNMRARMSQDQESDTQLKEGENRKRKQGLVSPGSTENKPEDDHGGNGNPFVKKNKTGPEPPQALASHSTSSRSYVLEDVQMFSEFEDDEEEADAGSTGTGQSLLRSNLSSQSGGGSESQRPGLTLKTKQQRATVETAGQKSARKRLKQNAAIAREEARKSLKELKAITRQEAAPRANIALQGFVQAEEEETQETCSGIIKKVKLFNFMCHESFEKEWHPNLNFITGQNGSGKSAVLSGILIGLGARATSTSRTKSIKGLVKAGKEFCKIEITLGNNGLLSDKYGEEVMIQRIIDSNGISSYKIDDGKSRMRTLKRTELDTLLVTLGIMLDNPVAILNQETARSFLRSKDPRDKYHLFYEGTGLAKCERVLEETKENVEATKANFRACREVMEAQKEELTRLKKVMAKFVELDRMGEQIDLLTAKYHWSKVIVEERVLTRIRNESEQHEKIRKELQVHLEDIIAQKDKEAHDAGLNPQNEAEVKTKLCDLGRQDKEAQLEAAKLNKIYTNAKVQIRTARGQIGIQKHTSEVLKAKVEELQAIGTTETDNAIREFEKKKNELRQDLANAEQEVTTARQDSEQFKHGADSMKAELNELEDKDRQLVFGLDRQKKELEALRGNSTKFNKYEAYGRPMVELVAKIQANNHRFRKPPRGPLGTCFKVKDEKWVQLVEFVLKDKLFDFLVDNQEDLKLMNEFIKQTFMRDPSGPGIQERRRSNVVMSKYSAKAFDVSRTRATTPNHPTILDCIEIENNDFIVSNALIDTMSIERILLIKTDREALDLLKNAHNPEFPKTCIKAYTLENSRITPDPKLRIDPFQRSGRVTLLKCSSQTQLRALERLIQEMQIERQDLAPILESKRQEEAGYREQYLKLVHVFRQGQKKLNDVKVQIATLAKNPVRNIAPDLASFVEELNELNELMAKLEDDEATAASQLSEVQPQLVALKSQREQIGTDIAQVQEDLIKFQEKNDKHKEVMEKFERNIRVCKNKLQECEQRCESFIPKLEKLQEIVLKKIEEAEKHGPRVTTKRTPDDLQQEYKEFSKRLEEAKRDAGDRDKIALNLKQAKRRYAQTHTEYCTWLDIFHMIIHSLGLKRNYFEKNVRGIAQRLSGGFLSLIEFRGYKGRLLIDEKNKELFYFVCPDGESDSKTTAALASNSDKIIKQYLIEYASGLSGGERSFATICFIIAMWQVMECPFFMLDEFDVFMDPFNRKTSQTALIAHADYHKTRQFFLFTPLELNDLPPNFDASVLRMFPPVRKSGALPTVGSDDEELEDDIENPQPGPSRTAPKRRR